MTTNRTNAGNDTLSTALLEAARALLQSGDDTGCSGDITVVDLSAFEKLEDVVDQIEDAIAEPATKAKYRVIVFADIETDDPSLSALDAEDRLIAALAHSTVPEALAEALYPATVRMWVPTPDEVSEEMGE